MFSAPSETFTILCRSRWEATFTLYADNRAQLLPIFASGAPRRAAHSHRHAHRTRGLAHEHAPPRTRRGTRRHNMHGTPWHSVTPHAHTHSPTHWAAIVREYLEVAMADE